MLARVQVRYPEIPILFLETRPLAEEWTFRYLGATLAEYEAEQGSQSDVRAAESPVEYGHRRAPSTPRGNPGRKT